MAKRQYDKIDRYQTWRVKVTSYGKDGRTRRKTVLVPATNKGEAENKARRAVPDLGNGYNFESKKVADYWREPRD